MDTNSKPETKHEAILFLQKVRVVYHDKRLTTDVELDPLKLMDVRDEIIRAFNILEVNEEGLKFIGEQFVDILHLSADERGDVMIKVCGRLWDVIYKQRRKNMPWHNK